MGRNIVGVHLTAPRASPRRHAVVRELQVHGARLDLPGEAPGGFAGHAQPQARGGRSRRGGGRREISGRSVCGRATSRGAPRGVRRARARALARAVRARVRGVRGGAHAVRAHARAPPEASGVRTQPLRPQLDERVQLQQPEQQFLAPACDRRDHPERLDRRGLSPAAARAGDRVHGRGDRPRERRRQVRPENHARVARRPVRQTARPPVPRRRRRARFGFPAESRR